MAKIGYALLSSQHQPYGAHGHALRDARCDVMVRETASGAQADDREALTERLQGLEQGGHARASCAGIAARLRHRIGCALSQIKSERRVNGWAAKA